MSDLVLSTEDAEMNVMIGLARLGTPVTWLGRVGDAAVGRRVTRELRAEGVEVVARVDPVAATGVILKSSPAPGRTEIVNLRDRSAGSRLRVGDLDAVDVARYGVVHVTGITPALSASAATAVTELVGRARAAGAAVSVDVNHRSRLWADPADAVASHRARVAGADVLFAGEDEAQLLVRSDGAPEDLAARLRALGPGDVVIKRGAGGAVALVDGALHRRAALPVTVVDTVGAGDGFVAGYLAELLGGGPVERRLDVGIRTGAASCESPGDWEGAPRRADLDRAHADPVSR